MVGHVKTPMLGDPLPEEVKAQTKGVFRGVHVFVSGGTWDWYRPIFPGDRIFSFAGEEIARGQAVRVRRPLGDPGPPRRGDQPARRGRRGLPHPARAHRAEDSRAQNGKYAEIEPAHYTDEDYERIDAIYASEEAPAAPRSGTGRT